MFGLPITVTPLALRETAERLFPESRHRSRRVRKKLVKRMGGEFRKVPTIWRTPTGVVMHPVRYAEFRALLAAQNS